MIGIAAFGRIIAEQREGLLQQQAALMALIQTPAPFRGNAKNTAHVLERLHKCVQRFPDSRLVLYLRPGLPLTRIAERQPEVTRTAFQNFRAVADPGHVGSVIDLLGHRVLGEANQLAAADRAAKEARGHIGQLVGLVDNEHLGARQQVGKTFLLQRHVCHEQVMIDHEQLGFERLLSRLHNVTIIPVIALAAEAVLRGRCHHRPDRRILRHTVQF